MSEQDHEKQIRDAFLISRYGTIVHCCSIIIDSGRQDLAKQILDTTKIDKKKFEELKAQNN